jgi:glucose/mannose-6-phosphate isomerase
VAAGIDGLPTGPISSVLLAGMGGSGIAGDVVQAAVGGACPVPIIVHKDDHLPGFVGTDTLVVAVSMSGGTEEVQRVADAALVVGAPLVAVSQGGRLAELATQAGVPHIPLDPTIRMPRAGIGALVVPLLAVLEDIGLVPDARALLPPTLDQLRRRRDRLDRADNEAAQLARAIGRTMPLVYGAGPIGATAATRWKAQCNENAKVPAWANRLPELCHNEVAGWAQHGDVTRQVFTLVELRHGHETGTADRRFELVDELMGEVVAGIHRVDAEGDGPLAQLFDLMFLGDVVSLHLAFQAGVDPGPIPALEFIKAGLSS